MSQQTPSSQFHGIEVGPFAQQRQFNTFQALNSGVDFGASTQTALRTYTGNMGGQWRNVVTAGVDVEFAIPHDLGRVPSFYLYNLEKKGFIYQLPDTGTPWTTTNIYVKSSVATSKLRIWIT